MFERFTKRARAAIERSEAEAAALGHNFIGTEHLLLGVLSDPDAVATTLLSGFGVTASQVRQRVEDLVGPGALSDRDADALSAIGIDLDAVREAAEASFGPGVLEAPLPAGCKRRPFTPRAKKALELSLRQALALKQNFIGTEHLLLGMLLAGNGVAVRVLAEHGVTTDSVLTRLRPGA